MGCNFMPLARGKDATIVLADIAALEPGDSNEKI